MNMKNINDNIDVIPNFPKQGIFYRDIGKLLSNYELRNFACDKLFDLVKDNKIDYVVGMESKGYIFGMEIAQRLKCGFIMLRKPNKLTNIIDVTNVSDANDIKHKNIISLNTKLLSPESNVLVVDDIIATGESISGAYNLIEQNKCKIVGSLCLIELYDIARIGKINEHKVFSLLKYSANSVN